MIVIVDEPFRMYLFCTSGNYLLSVCFPGHTPSGKIIKGDLRQIAAREWESRRRSGAGRERLVNL